MTLEGDLGGSEKRARQGRAFWAKKPAIVDSLGTEMGWQKGRLKCTCERPRRPPE